MCCNTDSHHGFQKTGHQRMCFCGCDDPIHFGPQFMTKKQKIARLERHLVNLTDQAEAVTEHIAQIKKEK